MSKMNELDQAVNELIDFAGRDLHNFQEKTERLLVEAVLEDYPEITSEMLLQAYNEWLTTEGKE